MSDQDVIDRIANKAKGKTREWHVDVLLQAMSKNLTKMDAVETKNGINIALDNGKVFPLSAIYTGNGYGPEKYKTPKHRLQCILWAIGPKVERTLRKSGFEHAGQAIINSRLCVVKDTTQK